MYLELLKKKGQLIDHGDDRGQELLSYAHFPLRMPISLKKKNVSEWDEKDLIWLNM